MSGWPEMLFGLDTLTFGDEGARLAFARPLTAWAWALVVVGAGAISGWSYWRLAGPRTPRAVLAVVRALALVLIVLLISGPQLVREETRVERDWVIVLADRSASMAIPDAPGGLPRETQLRRALEAGAGALDRLDERKEVLWLGFDGGAYDLAPASEGPLPVRLDDPDGRRTAIGASLDQALRRVAARPVSGVVLLSDGRSSDAPGRAALRRLQSERIPVHVVPLGSPDPVPDLAVRRITAPASAFVRDTLPVTVEIDALGAGPDGRLPGGRVELVDDETGRVLASRPLDASARERAGAGYRVTLATRAEDAGERRWTARVVPDGPDLIEENNTRSFAIDLVDRPIRVLYLDGYPRWEHRYVKNLMLRERSVSVSSLLLAADRRYIQEGDVEIASLPRTQEDWSEYDVVVIGDLRADLFGREQLEALREHVASRGGGLLWIGGPGATPSSWRGSPLADLLPMTLGVGEAGSSIPAWDEDVTMVRAPAAARLGLLALGPAITTEDGTPTGAPTGEPGAWPEFVSDPDMGWTRLRWAQRIDPDRLKPTAEVYAVGVPARSWSPGVLDNPGDAGTPLVIGMRYGAGRSLYVGTDETWRWRYGRGEDLQERFWLPLVRLLAREGLARSGREAVLGAAPSAPEIDQPVRITVELLDQSLVDASPETVTVRIERAGDANGAREQPPETLVLTPEDGAGAMLRYEATWSSPDPGEYIVRTAEPLLDPLGLEGAVRVVRPDDELRRPETDHALLEGLAEATEGRVFTPEELSDLGEHLPNRELMVAGTPQTASLWDTPLALILLVLLLTIEWIGRKIIRLA